MKKHRGVVLIVHSGTYLAETVDYHDDPPIWVLCHVEKCGVHGVYQLEKDYRHFPVACGLASGRFCDGVFTQPAE